jgi:hypothetical protein
MNKNSIKDFHPEDGRMDKIIRILEEKRGTNTSRRDNVYHFDVCTFYVDRDNNKIEVEGKHPITIFYSVSQLEKKAKTKLEEITKNGN